jgi:hypothetical protein
MEFSLSAEQRELKEAAAAFARAKLNQDLAKREEAGEFSLEAWQACARFGIQGLPVPAELGGGELSLRAWMSSLRGVDETAWFARDDLRPFGLMCLRMGWRLAKSPLARAGKHVRPSGFRHRVGRAASGPDEALIA